jgi:hypothetical protein
MRESTMSKVPDTQENLEICKRFCGPCPTFKPNELNKISPNALFCARGQSEKPVEEIEDKGCSCFGCEVFQKYKISGGWFCMHGFEGRK